MLANLVQVPQAPTGNTSSKEWARERLAPRLEPAHSWLGCAPETHLAASCTLRPLFGLVLALLVVVVLATNAQARKDDGETSGQAPSTQQKREPVPPAPLSFEAPAFTLPPRTIKDITELLDQHRNTNRVERERMLALADQAPPAGAKARDIIKFYYERSNAAGEIGRARQQISDLETALKLLRAEGISRVNRFVREDAMLMALSHANAYGGDFTRAVELRKESIQNTPLTVGKRATLAVYYLRLGDLESARKTQQEYLALERKDKFRGERRIYKNITHTHARLGDSKIAESEGNYAEAVRLARQALQIIEADKGNDDFPLNIYDFATVRVLFKAHHHGTIGRLLARQGRLAEAEFEGRNALTTYLERFGKYSTYTAEALIWLAQIVLEQGRSTDTESQARAALDIRDKVGADSKGSGFAAEARRALARALTIQGKWTETVQQYEQIAKDLSAQPAHYEAQFQSDPDWALALIRTGNPQRALGNLSAPLAKRRARFGDNHYDVAEMRGVVALAKAQAGDQRAALDDFLGAVPVLLNGAQNAGGGAARTNRRVAILEGFLDLLSAVHGTALETQAGISAAAEAFKVAEAARGQVVEQALAASAARAVLTAPGMDPALVKLAREEQDARQQIAAYEKLMGQTLASGVTGPKLQSIIDTLRTRIDRLRQSSRDLLGQIERKFPDYARLVHPQPATLDEARGALRKGEALIAFYSGEQRTYVWVVPAHGPAEFNAAPIGRAELTERVDGLRVALEPDAESLADIPPYDVESAHALFKTLLDPVRAGWQSSQHLLIVPHGPLAYLPAALFPTKSVPRRQQPALPFEDYREVPWLIREHALTQLPSTTSLVALRQVREVTRAERAFVGFADPVFGTESASLRTDNATRQRVALRAAPRTRGVDSAQLALLPRLPETADEVLSIAEALGASRDRDVFLRDAANEGRVRSLNSSGELGRYRVISFATHGLVPGDLDGLTQPALALSSPEAGSDLGDGLLTMEEILGLRLNADWAVLSACNTAAAQGAGAEAVSGLGRAFFYAGTRALLVSNWPVHSQAITELMTALFKRQAEDPSLARAEALRQAMLAMIDEGAFSVGGEPLFSYAHPLFWAPFTLVGDGSN